ncbi:MAG: LysE family transporter, partial [Leucobacter sp.]|nr:LysE family transporter [Leucobacter sp.]
MNTGLLLAFWAMSLMFVLLPGADWAYAISAGVRQRKGVLPAVAGMLAGHLTATTIVASGLAVLFAASGAAMTALTVAGALYLVWLGVATLRRPAFAQLDTQVASRSAWRLFVTGVGISLLNPKVFLLFL